ncbi:MAG: hypothetical protein CFK52_04210 [Chloracidobacterium sp. CP2_5A]|nr:MAG: hypothetical protein CFK52_04210 [Chloracidobacterium sp. CP2_5A]
MISPPPIPPEPTLIRRVIVKPDGRRLTFYDFEPADADAPPAPAPEEAPRHVGTPLESAAG